MRKLYLKKNFKFISFQIFQHTAAIIITCNFLFSLVKMSLSLILLADESFGVRLICCAHLIQRALEKTYCIMICETVSSNVPHKMHMPGLDQSLFCRQFQVRIAPLTTSHKKNRGYLVFKITFAKRSLSPHQQNALLQIV